MKIKENKKERKKVQEYVENVQKSVWKKVSKCKFPWWDNDHNPNECEDCKKTDWGAWRKFWINVMKSQHDEKK